VPKLGKTNKTVKPPGLWCGGCQKQVHPRLTNGREIYPHIPRLFQQPFWKCDTCKNYVGCHHRSNNPTTPLGSIPTREVRRLRSEIHSLLDPIWQSKRISRDEIYVLLAKELGIKAYHTAEINTLEDATKVISWLKSYTQDNTQNIASSKSIGNREPNTSGNSNDSVSKIPS
jgi:hypothetical protein